MKSTFKIMFFIRKDRVNAEGQAPIHARLTIDGQLCQFSTKAAVNAKIWDVRNYRAKGRSEEADKVNLYLDHFKKTLLNHYQALSRNNETVTPDMVRDKYLGKEEHEITLLSLFSEFVERQRKLIGIDITQSTFNKYDLTYRRLEEFLSTKKKKQDIRIQDVDHAFVNDFHVFLKVDKKLSVNSSEKLMRILKRVTTFAFKTGRMNADPFALYTIKKVKTRRRFLTEQEFARFYHFQSANKRLQRVRDIFVFACMTGMDYSTLSALTDDNIIEKPTGTFIITPRVKTREISHIKLLPHALELLKKFKAEQKGPYVIPMLSNNKYNAYLQELADRLEVAKHVTSHVARHTFATLAYGNGMSLGSIQKVLGHAKRSTTEIYAEMLDHTVEREMDQLQTVFNL